MKPRHSAEQSTVRVNKSEKMGKFGFAAAFKRETAPAAFGGISKLQPSLLAPTPAKTEPIVVEQKAETPSPLQHVQVEVKETVAASVSTPKQTGFSAVAEASSPSKQITVEEVLAMAAKAGPEDPQDQFICDSCQ